LELQFLLRSSHPGLQSVLAREAAGLFAGAAPVSAATWTAPDRLLNGGLRWANGAWIRVGWRFFAPFL
jgi:hypothetical protein